jgi:hypothetical protein
MSGRRALDRENDMVMSRASKSQPAAVGIADHGGWAILMTTAPNGALLDRRRVELIEPGLPSLPHHHEGQKLPLDEAVALVEKVRASAARCAVTRLEELRAAVPHPIANVALRACPPLPETIAECITSYRAMCVADWVMYRRALANAALEGGMAVHWYDKNRVLADAARLVGRRELDELFAKTRASCGPPWQVDHRTAMAAAIVAGRASGA